MTFTHTNKVKYTYTAGGVNETKEVSVAQTEEAEINLSYTLVLGSTVDGTVSYSVPGFEFATKAKAVSVYLRLDGVNGAIKADGAGHPAGGTLMANLDNGVPVVWSYNGGVSHPVGATNSLIDATTSLNIKPDAYDEDDNPLHVVDNSITLKVRVLYDPS